MRRGEINMYLVAFDYRHLIRVRKLGNKQRSFAGRHVYCSVAVFHRNAEKIVEVALLAGVFVAGMYQACDMVEQAPSCLVWRETVRCVWKTTRS